MTFTDMIGKQTYLGTYFQRANTHTQLQSQSYEYRFSTRFTGWGCLVSNSTNLALLHSQTNIQHSQFYLDLWYTVSNDIPPQLTRGRLLAVPAYPTSWVLCTFPTLNAPFSTLVVVKSDALRWMEDPVNLSQPLLEAALTNGS